MADVTLPQLGETVTEGTITQWFKQVGDTVAADEPLFEVSTDKVDTEVPSPVAGVVTEIRAAEGDTIDVGTVVAVVGDAGAAPAAAPAPAAESAPASEPTPAAESVAQAPAPTTPAQPAPQPAAATPAPSPTAGDNRLLSPVVRRLVNDHGINPDDLSGTGPGGRITREDVLDYIDQHGLTAAEGGSSTSAAPAQAAPANEGNAAPAAAATAGVAAAGVGAGASAAGGAGAGTGADSAAPSARASGRPGMAAPTVTAGDRDTSIPLSKIRKLTGDHMVMSKATSPHAFSVVEIDFHNVDRTRNKAKADFKAHEGFSLTYLPFIARALIDALGEFPNLNASVGDNDLVVHNYIDLAIAVDLDYEGLLAPVIRDAEAKRLRAIAQEISDKANRARERKLSPDEISGGTFTISNNGSAGSVLTMPIINQPQVAIVSTDAIVRRPVVATTDDGSEAVVIHPVGNLAMSWDHRAFDGAYAAGFLKRVKEILETRDWNAEL